MVLINFIISGDQFLLLIEIWQDIKGNCQNLSFVVLAIYAL